MAQSPLQHDHVDVVFGVRYRLSDYGGRELFPVALQDVLTSYLYLFRILGLNPVNTTVTGHSAGGNTALELLRYIEKFGAELQVPKPGHIFLAPPWFDTCRCLKLPWCAGWDDQATGAAVQV